MRFSSRFVLCTVTAYSGHKGEERPRTLKVEGRTVELLALRTMRIEEDLRSRQRRRFFDAEGRDGQRYVLCHEVASDRWSVERAS